MASHERTLIERWAGDIVLRTECAALHAERAVSVLAAVSRAGRLRPGIQLRFGWSLLRLADDGDALRVTEPDFAAWPEPRWSPSIDVTLGVLAAQVPLLQTLEVAGEDVFLDQFVLAATGALAQRHVFLHRVSRVADDDSGWLLGPVDDPDAVMRADNLERIAVASLAVRRRAVLSALVLPTGSVAVFSGDELARVFAAPR